MEYCLLLLELYLESLDGYFSPASYSNHCLLRGSRSISTGYAYFCKLSAATPVIPPSFPFYRGKPEIMGSNLDVLVTVGLSEKVCEDYRLAQEVCDAISKLADNPKVRLLACSLGHPEIELSRDKEEKEMFCIEKREK